MTPQELEEIQANQKWFEFISTLRPYLSKKQETPICQRTENRHRHQVHLKLKEVVQFTPRQ
jgi:hypothetical protein